MGILWHEVDQNHRIFEVRPSPFRCVSPSRLIGSAPAARQILWSFSIWLEAVAILPQVAVMQTDGECENVRLIAATWVHKRYGFGHFPTC